VSATIDGAPGLNEINLSYKNADEKKRGPAALFSTGKRPRLVSLTDCGGSSRCHNRDAFLALTDVELVLVGLPQMVTTAATTECCRSYQKMAAAWQVPKQPCCLFA
jgi:hypothetical protein